MIASTQTLIDVVAAALPSPPLPPLPPPLYIPPPVDRKDDIPETELPPRKKSCLFALGPKYEVEESSTARPTRGRGIDYGFVSTLDAEARRGGIREAGYGIRDTWVDPAEEVPKITPMTLGERVDLLMEVMIAHQETILIVEEEAYASREAWAYSIGLSQAVHYELQTHREQVRIMAPVTRRGPNTPPNNTNPNNMTPKSVQAMIDQALLRNSTNRDGSHSSYGDTRRNVQTARPCLYANFMKCKPLNFKGTKGIKKMMDKYCPMSEIKKLEIKLWNLKVKGNDVPTYTDRFQELTLICTKFVANEPEKIDKYISGLPDNIYGSVNASKPKTLDETIELANDSMDQKLRTYAERISGNTNVANAPKENKEIPKGNGCFECGVPGHFKKDCPKLKNKNEGSVNAQGWVYVVGNAEKKGNASRDSDSNVVTGTFLLNNRYASILFYTGADRSFISTEFSSLIDIVLTSLGNTYDVELADGKIVRVDTIIQGCTLNFLNHPFDIDLMPVELGSFDVIISMDWLRRYHAMIVCDEKLVRIPYGNEALIFHGDESNVKREYRLTIISCSKAQEYMTKGCQIFLAQISTKKEEDKSEGKQLKDVPIIRDFPEVFPEDLPGVPSARPVEFQIDLILRAAP
nr:reverse transcriptase domain-containing protein [Tanacetum cinerariifolium]